MNAVTFSNSNGRAFVKPTSKYARIFVDSAVASAISYPFTNPRSFDGIDIVEVFDEDGKRYKNVETFAEAFELTVEFSESQEAAEEVPLMEEVPVDPASIFAFRSIEELRRTWRQANSVAQRELKLIMTGTIRIGKQRFEKSKQWLEEAVTVNELTVERVATKWIFFNSANDSTLYAKEFEGTFRFE